MEKYVRRPGALLLPLVLLVVSAQIFVFVKWSQLLCRLVPATTSSFIKLTREETLMKPLTQQAGLLGGRLATKALAVALDTSPNQFFHGQAQKDP
jgi:hypothetical protein